MQTKQSRTGLVATVVIGLLVTACGTTGGASPAGSIGPTVAISPSGEATATPSPAPTEQATPSPKPVALSRPTDQPTDGACRENHPCLGLLPAGSYHTQHFSPGFGFTITSGRWENLSDEGGIFPILSIDRPDDAILFFRQPWPTRPDGVRAAGVATNVTELTAWLTANPSLDTSEPKPVTVGGLTGTQIDLALAPGTENADPSCPVQVCATVFIGRATTWEWDWGFAGPERQRLYLLEASDGGVVAIFVDSLDGTTFDEMTAAADEILPTIEFDKP
jgi:hypothetical protein